MRKSGIEIVHTSLLIGTRVPDLCCYSYKVLNVVYSSGWVRRGERTLEERIYFVTRELHICRSRIEKEVICFLVAMMRIYE